MTEDSTILAASKKHQCPQASFSNDQKISIDLQLDVLEAGGTVWQTHVVTTSETKHSDKFHILQIVGKSSILPDTMSFDRSQVRIAPANTYARACGFYPGNNLLLPLSNFRAMPWSTGQAMCIDFETVVYGNVNHKQAKYITVSTHPNSTSTLTYHHFEDVEQINQFQQYIPLALVSCQVVQVFKNHALILFNNHHYCVQRAFSLLNHIHKSIDLIKGQIYDIGKEFYVRFVNCEVDEQLIMYACFSTIHFACNLIAPKRMKIRLKIAT